MVYVEAADNSAQCSPHSVGRVAGSSGRKLWISARVMHRKWPASLNYTSHLEARDLQKGARHLRLRVTAAAVDERHTRGVPSLVDTKQVLDDWKVLRTVCRSAPMSLSWCIKSKLGGD